MNEVCKADNYRDKVFEMLPSLEVLDGEDKDGKFIESEDDDDDYGEEGELDMDDDILAQLDDDTRKRLQEGKIGPDELEALGLPPSMFLMGDEGGEDEQDEDPEAASKE